MMVSLGHRKFAYNPLEMWIRIYDLPAVMMKPAVALQLEGSWESLLSQTTGFLGICVSG
jgi:hypothetical protein